MKEKAEKGARHRQMWREKKKRRKKENHLCFLEAFHIRNREIEFPEYWHRVFYHESVQTTPVVGCPASANGRVVLSTELRW